MTCGICDLIKERKNVVYEDDKIFVFIPDKIAVPGHVIVAPKEHHPIMEQIPDPVFAQMFSVANKFSSMIFELFQAEGTNLFVQNGTPAGQLLAHTVVHVVPRRQNDNLQLDWAPKKISEDEMSTVEIKIKEKAGAVGEFEKEKQAPIEIKQEEEIIKEKEDEVNYLIQQLERIP